METEAAKQGLHIAPAGAGAILVNDDLAALLGNGESIPKNNTKQSCQYESFWPAIHKVLNNFDLKNSRARLWPRP